MATSRGVVWLLGGLAIGCAKPVPPTEVRQAPVHPDLQCPAGTVAAGLAPPQGHEAWCEKPVQVGPVLRVGPSLTWHTNGEKASQGSWEAGLRTGPWLFWHPNAQLSEQGAYSADEKQGIWTTYDSSGRRTAEGSFVAGSRDGDWIFWDPSAQTRTEGRYELGEREGKWVEFDPEGRPVRERDFRDDRMLNVRSLQ
ncbi:MAG: hypothetical protein AAGA48_14840 [Myxococcota bacterium]